MPLIANEIKHCLTKSLRSFLQNNDIEMYSKDNEGKSAVSERFISTLKNKIYKYMTLV